MLLLVRLFKLLLKISPVLLSGNILCRVIKSIIPILMLYIGKLLIDNIVVSVTSSPSNTALIWQYLFFEFMLFALSELLLRCIAICDNLLGELFSIKTSIQLITQAARLDLIMLENPSFHDMLERARSQTSGRVSLVTLVLTQLQELLTAISLLLGLLILEPLLVLLSCVAILPTFINELHFGNAEYSLVKSWTPQRRELEYLRFIGAHTSTAKEVKIFGLGGFLADRFGDIASKLYDSNRLLTIKQNVWGFLFSILSSTAYYISYIIIISKTISGLISLGDLTFLSGSFQQLRTQLKSIFSRFAQIHTSSLYLKDYFSFIDLEPETISTTKPIPLPNKMKEGFVFENVGFKYPGTSKWIVKNLSFTLLPDRKYALVGENGAGKTTIVKLISRLYEPTEGAILFEGVDIRTFDIDCYRRTIGIIFQDFIHYFFTASENISVGNTAAIENHNLVRLAAKRSLAHGLISSFPNKYGQRLGKYFEGGIDLSGGEWQKIALARAYIKPAKVLILDEPTASLDARAEQEIFKRFSAVSSDCITLIITHRFSTVRVAEEILVLKNGSIFEKGTHFDLIDSGGLYQELFAAQDFE